MVQHALVRGGALREASGPFARLAAELLLEQGPVVTTGPGTLPRAAQVLRGFLAYPLDELLASPEGREQLESEAVRETARCLVLAKLSGAFGLSGDGPLALDQFAHSVSQVRGGVTRRALWLPIRLCLTADLEGPRANMGKLFQAMALINDNVLCDYVPLARRIELLQSRLGV